MRPRTSAVAPTTHDAKPMPPRRSHLGGVIRCVGRSRDRLRQALLDPRLRRDAVPDAGRQLPPGQRGSFPVDERAEPGVRGRPRAGRHRPLRFALGLQPRAGPLRLRLQRLWHGAELALLGRPGQPRAAQPHDGSHQPVQRNAAGAGRAARARRARQRVGRFLRDPALRRAACSRRDESGCDLRTDRGRAFRDQGRRILHRQRVIPAGPVASFDEDRPDWQPRECAQSNLGASAAARGSGHRRRLRAARALHPVRAVHRGSWGPLQFRAELQPERAGLASHR